MKYILIGVCAFIVLGIGFLVGSHAAFGAAAASNATTLTNQQVFTKGVQVGTTTDRTLFSQIQAGTCTGITYASLSTTTPMDCAVTGARPGDKVLMQLPLGSTQTITTGTFIIADSGASTTSNYITGTLTRSGVSGFPATSSYPQATTSVKYFLWR